MLKTTRTLATLVKCGWQNFHRFRSVAGMVVRKLTRRCRKNLSRSSKSEPRVRCKPIEGGVRQQIQRGEKRDKPEIPFPEEDDMTGWFQKRFARGRLQNFVFSQALTNIDRNKMISNRVAISPFCQSYPSIPDQGWIDVTHVRACARAGARACACVRVCMRARDAA